MNRLTVRGKIWHAAKQALATLDAELGALLARGDEFAALKQAVLAVQQLTEDGLADRFWGDARAVADRRVGEVVSQIESFGQEVAALEARRNDMLDSVGSQHASLDLLADELYELEQAREDELYDWVVEREETPRQKLAQIMPWTRGFDDDRRFRQTLLRSAAAAAFLGLIFPFIELPIPERDELVEVPKRFAQLIERPEPPPPTPSQPVAVKPEETAPPEPTERKPEKPPEVKPEIAEVPAPAVEKQKSAREQVASKGILAFRESFSNLAETRPSARLGAQATVNSAGANASQRSQRNLITTQARGSSGGINLAAVSRDLGTGGGGAMAGVQTTQLESAIAGVGGVDRPLSAGAIAGRTDEEIQIVFDRYKAALYRLYNRELRKDPTLQGQIVLQLTIEPDGSVSFIEVRSSDMNAPQLAQQVVTRVGAFDFGAKAVPAITIVYPIDFLPTA